MARLVDRILQITGASLTGSNGDTARTYTIPYTTVSTTGMLIVVSQATLMDSDYTQANNLITFTNAIFDVQEITIIFKESVSGTASSTLSYATNLELSRFMNLVGEVPSYSSTSRENIGTGDNSNSRFWLDKKGVITGTYTLAYGASEASLTTLTETTHYTIDLETSMITLTSAGITAISTNNIYASYKYNILEITDQQITDALTRAEYMVDALTNNHFADSSDTTPNWNQTLDEEQDGRGVFDRNYFTLQKYPIPDVSTALNGAVVADDATITVDSTAGFPSSGYLLIGSDKIAYTGKTSTTFTGCTSVEAHDDGDSVKAYVVEISTTDPGGTISWDVLAEGTEFEIDRRTGRIHIYADGGYAYGQFYDQNSSPPNRVANRFRISYLSGQSSVPTEITQLTLMLASKDLMSMAVRKAHSQGQNDFKPSIIDVDQAAIDKMVMAHRNEQYAHI